MLSQSLQEGLKGIQRTQQNFSFGTKISHMQLSKLTTSTRWISRSLKSLFLPFVIFHLKCHIIRDMEFQAIKYFLRALIMNLNFDCRL